MYASLDWKQSHIQFSSHIDLIYRNNKRFKVVIACILGSEPAYLTLNNYLYPGKQKFG